MTRYLNRIWAVVLLAFISCALWGSAFPMIKIGYGQFGIADSGAGAKILFAGVRFIICWTYLTEHRDNRYFDKQ